MMFAAILVGVLGLIFGIAIGIAFEIYAGRKYNRKTA